MDTGIITSRAGTAGISIALFRSGPGQPIDIALSRTSLLFPLATAIIGKPLKMVTVKQEKLDAIKFLAQSKLANIANIISQTMQGGGISSIEFHKVLQEVEKYRQLKANSINQAKTKVRQIEKEQGEELAEQRRKEAKRVLKEKFQIIQVSRVSIPFKV